MHSIGPDDPNELVDNNWHIGHLVFAVGLTIAAVAFRNIDRMNGGNAPVLLFLYGILSLCILVMVFTDHFPPPDKMLVLDHNRLVHYLRVSFYCKRGVFVVDQTQERVPFEDVLGVLETQNPRHNNATYHLSSVRFQILCLHSFISCVQITFKARKGRWVSFPMPRSKLQVALKAAKQFRSKHKRTLARLENWP